MKVTKYPPSLLYLCITIGPPLLLLAFIERFKNSFTNIMAVYGRTAFFYYILHFYLIHTIATVMFFVKSNHTVQDAIDSMQKIPFLFVMPGEGYGLAIVYLIWAAVVITLYPICKRYDRYKANHKEKWWLSYLWSPYRYLETLQNPGHKNTKAQRLTKKTVADLNNKTWQRTGY